MPHDSRCGAEGEGAVDIWTYAKMQSIERMKAVRIKVKGISAHRRLTTSEARMLGDMSLHSRNSSKETF